MGIVQFKIQIDGQVELNKAFKGIIESVANYKQIFQNLVPEFHKMENSIFRNEGDVSPNKRWKDLSVNYYREKKEMFDAGIYRSMDILTATGRLRDSLTMQTNDSIINIKEDEMEIGTSVFYGIDHQKGKRRLAKRKFIFVSNGFRKAIAIIFKKEMQKKIDLQLAQDKKTWRTSI
jgi:phage gpG-like protein